MWPIPMSFYFRWPKRKKLAIAFEQHIYLLISLLLRHAIVEFMSGRNNNNNNNNNDGNDCIANQIPQSDSNS